jgi:FG-GAP repeat protein
MLRFRIVRPAVASSALVALSTFVAVCALAALSLPRAFAAGPGLPRTYDVQRVDAPNPLPSRNFGLLVVNGGDLNGDREDDLLVPQGTALLSDGAGAEDGEIHVISGADGSLIRSIPAPEPDPTDPAPDPRDPPTDRKAAFGGYVGKLADIGSCPAGDGADDDRICDSSQIGAPDGVPEIVASAVQLDVPTAGAQDGRSEDIGRVYVIDGKTGVVLKRIDMPPADRLEQGPRTEQLGSSPTGPVRPRFGATVLAPAGLPACADNAGVGSCLPSSGSGSMPEAVRTGDLDGGGRPDIVVGASFVQDRDSTNPACDDTPGPDNNVCDRSGRLYMYRGEEIAGSDPSAVLSAPAWNIKNPLAQADAPGLTVATEPELFGDSAAPVGDVGTCTAAAPVPGRRCPSAEISQTLDGKPEVLVSAARVDYPLQNPNPDRFDVGVALLLDGATGALLHTYLHPEPQAGSIFGFTIANQPAAGDLGHTVLPDLYLPAVSQNVQFRGQGRGYVLNGERVSPDTITLATLNDSTPQASGGFGTSSAGAGDLVGDSRNELLVGELSFHSPPQNPNTISDVHIFDPLTEQALQTIADPDQQAASNFGASLAPLGDLNGDGFLDLAVGAGRFDASTNQPDTGRLYVFRSNNTPPPTPAPSQEEMPLEEPFFEGDFGDFGFFEEDFSGFEETGETIADRRVRLRSSRARISLGRRGARRVPRVRLTGSVRATVNEELCEPSQRVLIQRRRRGGSRRLRRYRTFQRRRTSSTGAFKSREFRPSRTYLYRAVVPETEGCPAAVSNEVKITVTREAKRAPRRLRK